MNNIESMYIIYNQTALKLIIRFQNVEINSFDITKGISLSILSKKSALLLCICTINTKEKTIIGDF